MSVEWVKVKDYTDIIFEKAEGIGKITINRPEVRNAFRPETLTELIEAFTICREDSEIGVVILTGAGDKAFCSGGDQRVRGEGGYVGSDGVPRLNALDLQRVIKYLPKPVIAMVAGYAIGGGHVLHLLCDLTIAADNARFGQTGPRDMVPLPPVHCPGSPGHGVGQHSRPPGTIGRGSHSMGQGNSREKPHCHPLPQVRLQR